MYVSDKVFEKTDISEKALPPAEYTGCTFKNIDFSDADFSEIKFLECHFIDCNLSLAKLTSTVFQEIKFKNCKMLGLRFQHCNQFLLSVDFENCMLDHSSFYQVKIKKTIFKNTQLKQVDFTGCDLTGSFFHNCELSGAVFDHTVLEKVNLSTSRNYILDPENNKIKKAVFSLSGVTGLLAKYDIVIED